jgi:hypothetical protein
VYGADPGLRADLERRQIGYVLALATTHRVITAAGACQAGMLARRLPRQRYYVGAGTKGQRYYDWAWVGIGPARPGHRWLLIRRNRPHQGTGILPLLLTPPRPAACPGQGRWDPVDGGGNSQAAKGLTGLDEHQVRRWVSWYRWTTLAMLAIAFLTIAAAFEHARAPAPAGQIQLTRNEIAALFSTLVIQPGLAVSHRLRWSAWRRRHQHRAKTSHYQRQARQP